MRRFRSSWFHGTESKFRALKVQLLHAKELVRTATPITDSTGRIIAVLAGQPDDPSWSVVHSEAAELLEQTRPLLSLSKKARKHRRGRFGALSFGISHGGGQTIPGNLKQEGSNGGPMSRVVHHSSFERFSGFGSSTWARGFVAFLPTYESFACRGLCLLVPGTPLLLRRSL